MRRGIGSAMAWCLLCACGTAGAHEFWLRPDAFTPAVPDSIRLAQYVGENFAGEPVPFSTTHIASLRRHSSAGTQDLVGAVRAQPAPAMDIAVRSAGTHVIAMDSRPSVLTLDADKFNAYLRQEGLDAVLAHRRATGTVHAPGRERFRRNAKTLVRAGAGRDAGHAAVMHQRLEIMPVSDPFSIARQESVRFRILFDGKPLAHGLIKAWHRNRDGSLMLLQARSGRDGGVAFVLPFAGAWMISTVHMVPADGDPDIDWDSYWGSLTFAIPPP